VPGFNDSEAELREAARYIRSVSADIPWHVTAFHKDYKMTGPDNTDAHTLIRAAEIGYEEGLNFVYAGNMPGQVGRFENTYCPSCSELLIERFGYVILDYRITASGTCPKCDASIPGLWPPSKDEVRIGKVAIQPRMGTDQTWRFEKRTRIIRITPMTTDTNCKKQPS